MVVLIEVMGVFAQPFEVSTQKITYIKRHPLVIDRRKTRIDLVISQNEEKPPLFAIRGNEDFAQIGVGRMAFSGSDIGKERV